MPQDPTPIAPPLQQPPRNRKRWRVEPDQWRVEPDQWRDQVLTMLLRALAALAPFVYVPSVIMALRADMVGVVIVDTIAVIGVYALYFLPGIPFRARAASLMVIFYALGAWLLVSVGTVGQVYMVGFAVCTTLLLGLGPGLAATALNGATMLAAGAMASAAPGIVGAGPAPGLVPWIVLTANVLLVNLMLVLSVGAIIRMLERAVGRASDARRDLEHERKELLRTNQALAEEVQERARTEVRLQESESRYRSIFDTSPQPMWVYDLEDERFLEVNSATVQHYGYSRDEFLSMTIADVRAAEVSASDMSQASLRESESGFRRHRTRSGSIIDVEITGQRIDFMGRRAELVLAADVTDRLRADAARAELEMQLVQSQKMEAVGRLAGGVAHDFNNMLGVILGYIDLIHADPGTPEHIRRDLAEVGAAARHSAELTRQLLAFARQQTIKPEVLELNDSIEFMLKMLRRLIGEGIELTWSPAADLWPVCMDPSQIDRILVNLTVNARDAVGSAGAITIATQKVEVSAEESAAHPDLDAGDYTVLTVADNGHGMDRDTLTRIFEPFFTTKPQGQGTGLGLPMVYGIMRQNRGFIHASSEPGVGTAMKVYIPRHLGVLQESPVPRPVSTLATGSETVLIVEDEPALLSLARRLLERLGYTVLAAGSPAEAITLAREHPGEIDLLITDVIMPEMNGLELWKLLLGIRPAMKSVFMSGYTADIIADHGVLDEGIHFLPKPFSTAQLATQVRAALTAF